ncbi:MAG TPA: squalene--hopene cyclase [Beijerinckiaceae bacterium]|nr:squalene--hopene cyclase [Beijerinckiaceae bacterium]
MSGAIAHESLTSQSFADGATVFLDEKINKAARALMALQRDDGHFVFELEADATIPAEYVLLTHYLAETPDIELEAKIARYLRRIQAPHGGWPLFHDGVFDVSASVKAYFALKMIGDSPDAPHMSRARKAILAHGGAAQSNVFTRALLALYGQVPWRAVPVMPVEIMHLPMWFPFHLTKVSYWARTVLTPLMVLTALKPRACNPRGVAISELFTTPPNLVRTWPKGAHQAPPWTSLFGGLDRVMRLLEPRFPARSRKSAIDKAVAFVTERLNGEDGLGAIFPAMANSVMMFAALGVLGADPRRAIARRSIDKLLVVKENEAYCQPCVSPVWDTALACHALLEVGSPEAKTRARAGLDWLAPLQVTDIRGDWAALRPNAIPGGWAFQYSNPHYPDLDDTAVVVMAFDRAAKADFATRITRARDWVVALQSRNGGWGAFDADNTSHYLNNIPFADHGALLDPPTADVSARCVSMLAQLGETAASSAPLKRGLDYLLAEQAKDGSWFGRWGMNYIYGTWSALCALNAAGIDPRNAAVRRACDWLVAIQNADGGWGEDGASYRLDYAGYEPAPSTPSQTAWALLGLMASGDVDHSAVARGIAYLCRKQTAEGLWSEERYTATGFPRVFYLRYHGYAKFFPLWALARYRALCGEAARTEWGM